MVFAIFEMQRDVVIYSIGRLNAFKMDKLNKGCLSLCF